MCKGEGHTEEVIEEFTDVFVGLESVVDGRLEFGIYVSEVELLVSALLSSPIPEAYLSVKSQEYLIYDISFR